MGSYEENYLAKRPQSLCHMCGKCCRVVTPYPITDEELKKRFEQGDEAAVDFLSIFEPYSSVEAARAVLPDVVDNIINRLAEDGKGEGISFYYCKYLQDDNLCANYEDRPELCRHCPSTPWAIVPPGCGFEGWLFWKREEEKQRVRKAKEELLELKLLKQRVLNEESLKKIDIVEQKIKRNIDLYKKYGSEYW